MIAQIETDKATMDLTAFEAGTLQEILAPEGTTVAIGQPVARIGYGNGRPPRPPSEAAADAPRRRRRARRTPSRCAASADAPPTSQPAPRRARHDERRAEAATAPSDERRRSDEPDATRRPSAAAPPARPPNGKVRASPMARHIAAEHGLDLAEISGSGPQGRVIRADVEAAPRAQRPA